MDKVEKIIKRSYKAMQQLRLCIEAFQFVEMNLQISSCIPLWINWGQNSLAGESIRGRYGLNQP